MTGRLARTTLRDRWPLFLGAATILAGGVALMAASLFIMLGTADAPSTGGLTGAEAARVRDQYAGAATVMGLNVLLTLFMATFMTALTFSFITAQRRRELALLRLLGATRGQVLRLLLAEAGLTGVTGALLGLPLSLPATWGQQSLLVGLGMLPAHFQAPWGHPGLLLFCAATGLGIALTGVWGSARRAARLRPLEAFQGTGRGARVMTRFRWTAGLGALAVTAGLIAVAQRGDLLIALLVALMASLSGSVAAVLLSPLLLPVIGRVFGRVLTPGVLGKLATANVTDSVRRNATLCAPLIVLVGCLLALSGTLASQSRATGEQEAQLVNADLVVRSGYAEARQLQRLSSVQAVSTEVTLPAKVSLGREVQHLDVVAVDPRAYRALHRLRPRQGSLAAFGGPTVVLGPGFPTEDTAIRVGDTVTLSVGGTARPVRVVAALPETLDTTVQLLVPLETVPAHSLKTGVTESLVKLRAGQAQVSRLPPPFHVLTMDQWAAQKTQAKDGENLALMVVLVTLSTLYASLAWITTVVISATERRREFQVLRLAGLSASEVVKVNVIEGLLVVFIGLTLGLVVALGALSGIAGATQALLGTAILVFPWGGLLIIALGAVVAVGLSAGVSTARCLPIEAIPVQ